MIKRRISRQVTAGNVKIGGDAPISIQSMLNAPKHDISANIAQAKDLGGAGCDVIRMAVPDLESVKIISALKKNINTAIVADIHFDYKLALASIEAGVDKIRINPGNIGDLEKIKAVVTACANNKIPIRIGVNAGSLEKDILRKHKYPTADALVESAMHHVKILEDLGFCDTVISIKSSEVQTGVEAYRKVASLCDYPLHIGITEAGTERMGTVKSAVGIGSLLLDGIGDTIRVSITGNPLKEVEIAKNILKSCGILKSGAEIISCPTCGRCEIDIISIANEVESRLSSYKGDIKVAVMGCVVNGPGEAKFADIGIAGGKNSGVIIKKGEVLKTVSADKLVDELMREIENL